MACGCKKGAAAKAPVAVANVTPKATVNVQESKPEKQAGNRIIKRVIR